MFFSRIYLDIKINTILQETILMSRYMRIVDIHYAFTIFV